MYRSESNNQVKYKNNNNQNEDMHFMRNLNKKYIYIMIKTSYKK